jgi:hypothetical protein
MRTMIIALFLLIGITPIQAEEFDLNRLFKSPSETIEVAVMCFFQYEYVSGMNKICVYDCLGSEAAITISSVSLCPLNINR